MIILDEDCTEVMKKEIHKEWREETGYHDMSAPSIYVEQQINARKATGDVAKRTKGNKHLTKVGYMGENDQEVPRWALDNEIVKRAKIYQLKNKD